MGAVVMTLALNAPCRRMALLVQCTKEEGYPFLALVEHTNLFQARILAATMCVRGDYLELGHSIFR